MKFVYDDGGRMAAGYRGRAGDCVTRAVAIATEQPYEIAYEALSRGVATQRLTKRSRSRKLNASDGVHTRRVWFKQYMESLGWIWRPTMLIGSGCKVHLIESELPGGRLIVSLSKHYSAVIDGVIHDTYDPSRDGTRCVYGYWEKA